MNEDNVKKPFAKVDDPDNENDYNNNGKSSRNIYSFTSLKKIVILVAVILVLVLAGLSSLILIRGSRYLETNEGKLLSHMPLAELAVYDFVFDIITRATETESGNVSLLIVTGGHIGKGSRTEILYHGCVRVKYGVDLRYLSSDNYKIEDDAITIVLPRPKVIGKPEILNDGECKSEVLATKPTGWFSSPNTVELQQEIRKQYQLSAPEWVKRFELESLVRSRIHTVLRLFLFQILKEKDLIIEYHDSNQKTAKQGAGDGF